jgi:hypothetical protein
MGTPRPCYRRCGIRVQTDAPHIDPETIYSSAHSAANILLLRRNIDDLILLVAKLFAG